MTDEQAERLIAVLERIATRLDAGLPMQQLPFGAPPVGPQPPLLAEPQPWYPAWGIGIGHTPDGMRDLGFTHGPRAR